MDTVTMKKILIIEDDITIRSELETLLKGNGKMEYHDVILHLESSKIEYGCIGCFSAYM